MMTSSLLAFLCGNGLLPAVALQPRPNDSKSTFSDYRDYRGNDPTVSVVAFLRKLRSDARGDADLFNLTNGNLPGRGRDIRTHENNTILGLRIGKGAGRAQPTAGKETFLITGCYHAREWISVEVPLRLAEELLKLRNQPDRKFFGVENGPTPWTVSTLLDKADVIFVPVLNPDGYIFSGTAGGANRLWRKNRRPVAVRIGGVLIPGVGTDINRNFPFRWGTIPQPNWTSDDPRRPTFFGIGPGSEPETQAVMRLHDQFSIIGAVNVHSFLGVIFYPSAYTDVPLNGEQLSLQPPRSIPDRDYFIQLAERWAKLSPFKPQHDTYVPAQSGQGGPAGLYLTSGDADDWAFETKQRASITLEVHKYPLRAPPIPGFQPEGPKLGLVVEENLVGMLYFLFSNSDRELRNAPTLRDRFGRNP